MGQRDAVSRLDAGVLTAVSGPRGWLLPSLLLSLAKTNDLLAACAEGPCREDDAVGT